MDTPPTIKRYKNLRFPAEIISHAVWLYFRFCLSFRDRPHVENWSKEDIAALESELGWVTQRLRKVHLVMMTAEWNRNDSRRLSASVLDHLAKAAVDLSKFSEAPRSVFVWEVHLATEKSLKAFLVQRQSNMPPHIHDLQELQNRAIDLGFRQIPNEIFCNLPRPKDAIGSRYGEGNPFPIEEAYGVYKAGGSIS